MFQGSGSDDDNDDHNDIPQIQFIILFITF